MSLAEAVNDKSASARALYEKLEDRVLARDQVGASECYYDLVRDGRPPPEMLREAVRIHGPYTHVPYHERIDNGFVNFVNNDHCLLSARATLHLSKWLPAEMAGLRLDRLAPVREVAQIGAALGRQFSHALISAVAPMPQPQLDDALAELLHAELIFRRGTPPDAEYTFKHALVQDAAYGTLLRERRQQLHARIAATLEDRFLDIVVAQPALLARHCAEAGLAEKAVVHWLKAGQQALARSATTEAAAQLRKGLDA